MIPYFVSFHPGIKSEENLALFEPIDAPEIQELLKKAVGVILPAYTPPWRYRTIISWARSWFPRLGTRFAFQGKTRQVLLFRSLVVRHPESLLFENTTRLKQYFEKNGSPWGYPLVLKGDLGGGGSSVFPIYAGKEMVNKLDRLSCKEPVLIQRWVYHGGKDLRVVVYGDHAVSYFRVGNGQFYNNVCRGGYIDSDLHPELQARGTAVVKDFCRRAQIDIAGFDLMFPDGGEPVFIEINFHFGRKGLGGTAGHQTYMRQAVERWRTSCLKANRI